jgi:ABC-2 type transport system ATP-binding protein
LSSHILSEVESVADTVGILREGRLLVTRAVEELKARTVRRFDLTFAREVPADQLRRVEQVRDVEIDGRIAHVVIEGTTAALLQTAAPFEVTNIVTHEPDLGEIFLSYYNR